MIAAKGYAVHSASDKLSPWNFERRAVGAEDVLIEILYSGICHSDIHQVRSEWGPAKYPMVPGHEIVGKIIEIGSAVSKFKIGDIAGIGCMVNSCQECSRCNDGQEQFCQKSKTVYTYNSLEHDGITLTQGGYSNKIVCNQNFVLNVSSKLPLANVAPLLCAGVTTFSPLKKWKVGKGHKVAILGLGGLGHMAVKFAVSFGAEVTLLSRSATKEIDARKLGAHRFVNTADAHVFSELKNEFDFIINTVSAPHNYNQYLNLLNTNGVMICVGIPPEPIQLKGQLLLSNNRAITGSSIGGIKETQEMLDYCAANNISSDIELIDIKYVNEAYERVINSDVKYRFVIDMKTL